ncbi:fructose-bisphosphate aldolase [Hypericibacter terrae]|uniref:Fructose-bisphosphate aldolase n=1 Tax=Hypericibacter terrae TaxID=2602015 RepID=A0A5J6MTB2_9PROT|nr:class I fructose-bisphosphate aldolase [Hypericibacter terrae]QEX19955.1 fructose-bisphosphate aldolase [Hypericibacter terrae]
MSGIIETARQLVSPGKGLLAADESLPTIKKRFDPQGIASTEETRRAYRDLLFTTPGMENCISGVILFEETLRQATASGDPFPQLLAKRGIIPGIKVDAGTAPLGADTTETMTKGLEGLPERLSDFRRRGARFAKWRAVIHIDGDRLPTAAAISANATSLARYARDCQDADLTPIVEPEVLMDGSQNIDRSADVTRATLDAVFKALDKAGVRLEGMLLKPNMVVPGAHSGQTQTPEQIADATLECLRSSVPPQVPGILFLSGGQSPEVSTRNLRAIVRRAGAAPWRLSFSFGRALQDEALAAWKGRSQNLEAAQSAFLRRAEILSEAVRAPSGR